MTVTANGTGRAQRDSSNAALVNNGNTTSALVGASSPYRGYTGGGGMYGGYGGMGMYGGGFGGMGGMMSPYYGMMSPGPLSGLNQLLFSVQSVIFSLGQAVQIIGMNAQGLRQLFESATSIFDHAIETWQEMQLLEQRARHLETPQDRKRRARLRALRMALVAGISYLGYRLVRRLLFPSRRRVGPAIGYQQGPQTGYSSSTMPYGPNTGYY